MREELAWISLIAFAVLGLGILMIQEMASNDARYKSCVDAGMQWVGRNCVK